MSRCGSIFTIVREPPTAWLPDDRKSLEVVNVLDLYAEGELRTDNYYRVAKTILNAMLGPETVGYVTYGKPDGLRQCCAISRLVCFTGQIVKN